MADDDPDDQSQYSGEEGESVERDLETEEKDEE